MLFVEMAIAVGFIQVIKEIFSAAQSVRSEAQSASCQRVTHVARAARARVAGASTVARGAGAEIDVSHHVFGPIQLCRKGSEGSGPDLKPRI